MTTTSMSSNGECRMLPLAHIDVEEDFNPRSARDRAAFEQLVASVKQHGVLQPILVAPKPDGGYRLIAGEGRVLAAAQAGCTEIPALVRETEERTAGLELALAENMVRAELNPVDEALGFDRLRKAGLTKKGIAERLGVSQKLVTERLQILELPAELRPQIADGTIPPGAIKALIALDRIHPGLPAVAAARVGAEPTHQWDAPLAWTTVVEDPVGAVIADYDGEDISLPSDVYDAAETYAIGRFSLTNKAQRDLHALCKLIGGEPEEFSVRFGREAVEQALALGAAHPTAQGWHHLIVGQEIADQLACDYIAAALKNQRAMARQNRATEESGDARGDARTDAAPSEEELKRQRRTEREAERERRRAARAFNSELGAAILKHLARLKVDADVLKILTAIDVAGDIAAIAARGARYGFPGWAEESQTKNGTVKVEYLDKEQAAEKARAFLSNAGSLAELAGRLFCLVAMARYANESDAVANSKRSFYELSAASGLPFSHEVVDLIDGICADRLPSHLTKQVRDARVQARKDEQRRERERAHALKRLDGIEERLPGMTPDERKGVLADADIAFGEYSTERWRIAQLVRDADSQATPPAQAA